MTDELHASVGVELTEPNPSTSLVGGLAKMLREIRSYRYLISNFVRRDLRVKYRNSALGYFWSLLDPLLLSGVYVVLFLIVAGNPHRLYPLWVVIGVLCWRFFGNSFQFAVSSLTGNEGTIKSIYFPRCLFAVAAASSNLAMVSLNLMVAVPFLVYFRMPPTIHLLLVPGGLALLFMLGLGLGLALACLNVLNRDVAHLSSFLLRAGFYVTPVLWTVEMAHGKKHALRYLLLNPVAVPITMVRNGLTGRPITVHWGYIIWSVVCSALTLLVGAMIFQRYEARVVKKL